MKKNNNIFWHKSLIKREDREKHKLHKSFVIWFTGLPSSGKSTIAHHVEKVLFDLGCHTYVFDGDNIRHGLCRDLGFSKEERKENIRRIAEVIKLFLDAGIICLTAFVSPYRKDREMAKKIIGEKDFFEVYVKCPVEVCESRDKKGLYKKARMGLIQNYTGVNEVYEEPANPDLILETDKNELETCVNKVIEFIKNRSLLKG